MKKIFKRIKAFTLAEVLITLGIIGVVATMTIPTLMNNIQDAQFKTAYAKAYSMASQAWLMAYTNEDLTPCSTWTSSCNNDNFNAFKKQMKVLNDCGTNTASCWNFSGEQVWNNTYPASNALSFIDSSGAAWAKCHANPDGSVLVDTNGNKPPNQYGKDRAIFTFCDFSIATGGCQPNIPAIYTLIDVPNATMSGTSQLNICPSKDTHPCYYQSWITGAK